jgi:membrane associated rhomboid family serine protease
MIPIGDDNSDRRTKPVVTWAIIAVNVLVFVLFQRFGNNDLFINAYAMVPAEIISGRDVVTADQAVRDRITGQRYLLPGLQETPVPVYLTILFSMFMHAGIAHIAGNMLYLAIFGDNIEDRLGHVRYLLFYLAAGVAASLAHVLVTKIAGSDLTTPTIGASGAISGVMGAYILLFPRRRIRVLLSFWVVPVPAVIAVGLWFAFQIISGLGYLGGGSGGGVAYAAHIGGFLFGLATVKLWTLGRPARAN